MAVHAIYDLKNVLPSGKTSAKELNNTWKGLHTAAEPVDTEGNGSIRETDLGGWRLILYDHTQIGLGNQQAH